MSRTLKKKTIFRLFNWSRNREPASRYGLADWSNLCGLAAQLCLVNAFLKRAISNLKILKWIEKLFLLSQKNHVMSIKKTKSFLDNWINGRREKVLGVITFYNIKLYSFSAFKIKTESWLAPSSDNCWLMN